MFPVLLFPCYIYLALFILILGFVFWAYSSLMLAIEEKGTNPWTYSPDESLSAMKTFSIPLLLTALIALCSFSAVLKLLDADNTSLDKKVQKDSGNKIESTNMGEIDKLNQNSLNNRKEMIKEIQNDNDSPFPHIK